MTGNEGFVPKDTPLGARPCMTICAPSAATMAPLSVQSDGAGTVSYVEGGVDARNYRVSFGKIAEQAKAALES